jgi:5-methyltetrahydropteroyltriglutamate--homocysteine methyltransferase
VRQVVRLQRDSGIDFVNEGELTKGGNFVTYINERLSGFEAETLRYGQRAHIEPRLDRVR